MLIFTRRCGETINVGNDITVTADDDRKHGACSVTLILRLLTGTALAVVSCCALSAERGFYFGAICGQADYKFETPSFATPVFISSSIIAPPPAVVISPIPDYIVAAGTVSIFTPRSAAWTPADDDRSSSWGAFAGYRIFRYAAVELSYLNLGTLNRQTPIFIRFPGNDYTLHEHLETTGVSASALGILPITEYWNVYGRAGAFFANSELRSSIAGSGSSISFGSQDLTWGAGTQLDAGKHWSVRVDYQRFESVGEKRGSGEADVDLLTLGLLFRL